MEVTGTTITDTQIQMVKDYETTLLTDPDPVVVEEAQGWIDVCDKALAGNPKDRSKVAFRYNELLSEGLIPGTV